MILNPFALRPAPGNRSTLFITEDGPVSFVDDGTAWRPYFANVEFLGTQPPAAANFTEIAAGGTSTIADYFGTIRIDVSFLNTDIWQFNTPIAAPYTIDVALSCLWAFDGGASNQPVCGIALRDSTSGHFYRVAMYYNGGNGFHMQVQRFTALGAPGSVISDILNTGIMRTDGPLRFEVTFDGATYSLFTTQDGKTFGSPQVTWAAEAFAAVDHVGIYVGGGNAANVDIPTLLESFSITP